VIKLASQEKLKFREEEALLKIPSSENVNHHPVVMGG
jgi:hypothetical protein